MAPRRGVLDDWLDAIAPPSRGSGPTDPVSSLLNTFSSTYHAPQKGQERPWDFPSAVVHRGMPTTVKAVQNVLNAVTHPSLDPRLGYNLYNEGWPFSDPVLHALHVAVPQKPAPGSPSIAGDIARGVNQSYLGITKQHPYPNPQNFMSTAVQDPGGTGMLVGSLAAGLEPLAGEGLLGTTLGVAKYADPLHLAGAPLAGGARMLRTAVRGGAVFDKTGAFTPKARAMIAQVAPDLTDADLARPEVKSALGSAMQNKGVNAPAVREGLIAYHDVPAPRGPTIGKAPPAPARATTDQMIADGKRAIGQKVQAIAGQPVSPNVLGDTLSAGNAQATTAVDNAWKTARASPGMLDGATFQTKLGENIKAALEDPNEKIESDPTLLAKSRPNLAQTIVRLTDATKAFGDAGKLTFPNISDLRKGIGSTGDAITPHETGLLKGAVDKTVADIGAMPPEAGAASPDTTPESFTNYSNARQASTDYHKNFGNDANSTVKSAVNKSGMKTPDSPGDVNIGGSADTAHETIAKKLPSLNASGKLTTPVGATQLYEDLINGPFAAPDAKQALHDYIRQTVLETDPKTGAMVANPDAVRDYLKTTMGQQVFSPTEASDLRMAASANEALDNPMTGGGGGGGIAGRVMRAFGTGAASAAIAPVIPAIHAIPWVIREPLVGALAAGTEAGIEAGAGIRARMAAKAGAPTAGGIVNPITNAAEFVGTGAPVISRAHAVGLQTPTPAPTPEPAPDTTAATPDDKPVQGEGHKWDAIPGPAAAPTQASEPAPDTTAATPDDKAVQGEGHKWDTIPGPATPQAAGGRIGFAVGGQVGDLVENLMQRAERAQRASQASTKPLLGLSDETVARALQVAQRGL